MRELSRNTSVNVKMYNLNVKDDSIVDCDLLFCVFVFFVILQNMHLCYTCVYVCP